MIGDECLVVREWGRGYREWERNWSTACRPCELEIDSTVDSERTLCCQYS